MSSPRLPSSCRAGSSTVSSNPIRGTGKSGALPVVKTSVPSFLLISRASLHDVNVLDVILYESGSFYVMDKAYIDFARLYVRFIFKRPFSSPGPRTNMRFRRMYSRSADKEKGVSTTRSEHWRDIIPKKDIPKN